MVRKPGGKYRGVVGRQKGDDARAAHADAVAKQALRESLERLQHEKRDKERMARRGLQTAKEEEEERKKQKIGMMLGSCGVKKLPRKYFNAWQIGVVQTRRERDRFERANRWKAYCEVDDVAVVGHYHCKTPAHLHNVSFEMPFNHVKHQVRMLTTHPSPQHQRSPSSYLWTPTRTSTSPLKSCMSSQSGKSCSLPSLMSPGHPLEAAYGSPTNVRDSFRPATLNFDQLDCKEEVCHATSGIQMRYDRKRSVAVVASALPNEVYLQDATRRYNSEIQHLQSRIKTAGVDHIQELMADGVEFQENATFDV